jgi:hypothetical protein
MGEAAKAEDGAQNRPRPFNLANYSPPGKTNGPGFVGAVYLRQPAQVDVRPIAGPTFAEICNPNETSRKEYCPTLNNGFVEPFPTVRIR